MNQNNPFEYEYSPNHTTEVPSNVLLNLLMYFAKVKASQPSMGILYTYPNSTNVIKDNEGNVVKVDVEWEMYKENESGAYFANIENPQPIATELAILSDQLTYAISSLHQDNIEKGEAKKRGELTKEQEDEQFTQTLSKTNKAKAKR